ncbi:MAG: hypothetical protein ACR2GY_06755, partial [Phycisphaerales bacterium]
FDLAGGCPTNITEVTIGFGTLLTGGIEEIMFDDGNLLKARSAYGFLSSEPNVLRMKLYATTENLTGETIHIRVVSRLNNPGGNVELRLRDWNLQQYQTIDTYTLGVNEQTENITLDDAANYIRAGDGEIELRIKHVVVATFSTSGFVASIDRVRIGVE